MYKDLKEGETLYMDVTNHQLLSYLSENGGGLHVINVVNLPTEMQVYYINALGIPEYINMLDDSQNKASRARIPISEDILVAISTKAVLAAKHFPWTT